MITVGPVDMIIPNGNVGPSIRHLEAFDQEASRVVSTLQLPTTLPQLVVGDTDGGLVVECLHQRSAAARSSASR